MSAAEQARPAAHPNDDQADEASTGSHVDRIGGRRWWSALSTSSICGCSRTPHRGYCTGADVARIKRHQTALLTRVLGGPDRLRGTGPLDGVSAGIDECIDLHRTLPGFRALNSALTSAQVLDGESAGDDVIADHLTRALIQRFAIADIPHLRTLGIAVTASNALITLAFRRQPDGDEQMLTEAKTLVLEYLHRSLNLRPAT
ncbi:hypothetical protein ACVCAH_37280 [Micromonospora sp. LZ34]